MSKFRNLSPDEAKRLYRSDLVETISPEDRINAMLAFTNPQDERFDTYFFSKGDIRLSSVKQTSERRALVTYKFTVDKYYCNGSGNLHGGAQSMIYDVLTSLALISIGRKDFWLNGGVSRTLAVTYLKPAPEGTKVVLECEILQMGKATTLLKGEMKREADGESLSFCTHDKAAVRKKAGWDDESPGHGKAKI